MRVLVKLVDNPGAILYRKTCWGLNFVSNEHSPEEWRNTYSLSEAKQPLELKPVFNDIRELSELECITKVIECSLGLHPIGHILHISKHWRGLRVNALEGDPLGFGDGRRRGTYGGWRDGVGVGTDRQRECWRINVIHCGIGLADHRAGRGSQGNGLMGSGIRNTRRNSRRVERDRRLVGEQWKLAEWSGGLVR